MASVTESERVADEPDEGFSFLDFAIVLAKHKRPILGLPIICAIVAVVASFLLPNIYSATAKVLPPQQGQSTAAAMLSQLGALTGATGGAIGVKNPNDLYVGMLKSRSVADAIIGRFKLRELYEKKTMVETRKRLAKNTRVASGRDGIISIEVEDEDPKRAAAMVNAYVEELEKLNERLAVTEASQRRLFFEKQLRHEKDALAAAEVELKRTQERTGLIKLDDQGRAIIEAVAEVRAQIAAKEVQIGAMRSFATDNNPQLVRAQQELVGLHAQLRKMESSKGSVGNVFVSTARVPEAGLEFVRRYRDVKYHETVFDLLAKQYEIARLDEAKDSAIIQVLDPGVPPDKKSSPKRGLIALVTLLSTGSLALVAAFVIEAIGRARQDQSGAERLRALKRHLTGLRT